MAKCAVSTCPNRSVTRGWCQTHYLRWRRTGNVQADVPIGRRKQPLHCTVESCGSDTYAQSLCEKHYRRKQRHGDPLVGEEPRPTECSVDGCDKPVDGWGWCHGHYQRWQRDGDVAADEPLSRRKQPETCTVEDCEGATQAQGYCGTHYKRAQKHGDPFADAPVRVTTGDGWINHGYYHIPVPPEDRYLINGETKSSMHRFVMAKMLGRPLHPDETVHHRNGVRTDNRPENLELWSTAHPKGQRVEDKVEHAVEMLQRYRPDLLA